MATGMFCFLPLFQIHQFNLNNEDSQSQQVIEIDFDRLAERISDEIMDDLYDEETESQQVLEIHFQGLSDLFNEMCCRE